MERASWRFSTLGSRLLARWRRFARGLGWYGSGKNSYLSGTPLFDAGWYLRKNNDVADLGINPIRHYLRFGMCEGRDPSPLFSLSWYVRRYPDVASRSLDPLAHYVAHGSKEGRQPHPLFDSAWYLGAYPDIAAAGVDPLEHFLLFGAAEGRDPCALFSTHWYFERYPDVVPGVTNPLIHYLLHGALEGRWPNPAFDSAWYLCKYQDVEKSGMNPLVHYSEYGWREGRDPSAQFDATLYRTRYPDIAAVGIDSLIHYVRLGRLEDRRFPRRLRKLADYLPVSIGLEVPLQRMAPGQKIHVIVPVYRGREETLRCLDSVANSACESAFLLHVINDASPDAELTDELRQRAGRGDFIYDENPQNLGFVRTVNAGMKAAIGADVILLNSDTEVAAGWLDRLVAHAYAEPDIATVAPISNNATICSYPDFNGRRALPAGESVDSLDCLSRSVNVGRGADMPTVVGYCMYIRRAALEQTGYFDEEAFGRGYGEENDFCRRAAALGWRHRLACDVFVFHAGETSFQGEANEAKNRAAAILRARHPSYDRQVAAHVAEDPAAPFRIALTAARWRNSGRPAVLFVTHALGGGTERHLQELVATTAVENNVLILRPARTADGGIVELSSPDPYAGFSLQLDAEPLDELASLLRSFGTVRAHVHHVLGYSPDIRQLLRLARLRFDFTVHDYFTICPQINLIGAGEQYCGEPKPTVCDRCIRQRPTLDAQDIRSWRLRNSWLIRDAERVFCPSQDVARRMLRHMPAGNCVVVPHEVPLSPAFRNIVVRPRDSGRFCIAVLGVLAAHKGRDVVFALAKYVALHDLPLDFVVIGEIEPVSSIPDGASLRATGRYKEHELAKHIQEVDPHLIYFPSLAPETYSYTLTAAIASRRPIVAPALGAFTERLRWMPWCWILQSPTLAAHSLASELLRLCQAHVALGLPPALPAGEFLLPAAPEKSWDAAYSGRSIAMKPDCVTDIREPGVLTILVICEWLKLAPSPCASIRILQPLEALGDCIRWRVVTLDELESTRADMVITHRTALSGVEEAERLEQLAKRWDMPLLYDLDDSFLDLDPESIHASQIKTVSRLLAIADEVWVSTPMLAARVADLTRNEPIVVRNSFLPAIWGANPNQLQSASPGNKIQLVYMGTRTHREDFELIEPALARLKKKFADRVVLNLVGVVPLDSEPAIFEAPYAPALVGGSYPAFVSWLQSINTWHIGLSPLMDSPFNRCKSEIKAIDYAALGLVPVLSDLEPYRNAVTSGVNGILVPNSGEAWYDALEQLVLDTDLCERLRVTARELLSTRFAPEPVQQLRLERLHVVARTCQSVWIHTTAEPA